MSDDRYSTDHEATDETPEFTDDEISIVDAIIVTATHLMRGELKVDFWNLLTCLRLDRPYDEVMADVHRFGLPARQETKRRFYKLLYQAVVQNR